MDKNEITPIESADDYELPSYNDVGYICVEIIGKQVSWNGNEEWEIGDYTHSGSAFWIQEGVGIDYFINDIADLPEIDSPGIWLIEGITGSYIKGEWGFTDDDEEWDWTGVRKLTDEEAKEYL